MTEEIIRDYFLRAGASFRRSESWKEDFEITESKSSNHPKSKVLRSGRFGIGALGAFLIGNEIEVETRHITSSTGFRFKTALETEAISLEKDDSILVGTSVRIRLGSETHKKLRQGQESPRKPRGWDWYVFSKPSVARFLPNSGPKRTKYRGDLFDPKIHWRKLDLELPYEIYWTNDRGVPALTCNGLFINNGTGIGRVGGKIIGLPGSPDILRYPSLAILDPDGHFPLSLQRNDLSVDDFPFGQELITTLLLEMMAWLFFHGPKAFFPLRTKHIHLEQWFTWGGNTRVVLSKDGYGLDADACFGKRKFKSAIFCEKPSVIGKLNNVDLLFIDKWNTSRLQDRFYYSGWPELHLVEPKNSSVKSFSTRSVVWQRSAKSVKGRKIEVLSNGWKVIADSGCPRAGFILGDLPKPPADRKKSVTVLEEIVFEEEMSLAARRWLIDELWDELFEGQLLPYDNTQRLKQFPKAAQKLAHFNVTADLNIRESYYYEED